MIKHIVFFKLNENGHKNKDEIVKRLNQLKDDIDLIKELETGINFADELRAFDLSLTILVESKETLNKYASHSKHQEFINFVKPLLLETKVVDYEIDNSNSTDKFENSTITKKASVYFDGHVTSRTILDKNGSRKTLGIMLPGSYTFNTEQAEHMEIVTGNVEVQLANDSHTKTIISGEYFNVPANSHFNINVLEVTDYCCSYLD